MSEAGGIFNGSAYAASGTVAGVVTAVDDTPATTLETVGLTYTYYAGTSASGTPLSGVPNTAGTYTVVVTFAGSSDYQSASASITFTIGQATPTLNVTDAGGAFNGQAFPATALMAGIVAGVDDTPAASLEGVAPTLDYQQLDANNQVMADLGSSAPTFSGVYQVIALFGGSTDYGSVGSSTTFTIT